MARKWKTAWKNILCLGMLISCMCMFTSCSRELTPTKLMEKVSDNMSGVTSFANSVRLDIELEDVLYTTAVSMDIDMESTMEPKAGHAKGTAHLKMRGAELESVLEIYQLIESGRRATYSSLDGNWSKEVLENTKGSGITLDNSLFSEMAESVEDFRIAEGTVDVDGKECYQMYGDVTGENLKGLLGSEMLNAYGLVKLPDEDAISELMIPITFNVYKEELLPARIVVDMSNVMNSLYDEYDKTTNVNSYSIKLDFGRYGEVGPITVPEEIKSMTGPKMAPEETGDTADLIPGPSETGGMSGLTDAPAENGSTAGSTAVLEETGGTSGFLYE